VTGGPVDAFLARWWAHARAEESAAKLHPRGSYEDGERRGRAKGVADVLRDLEATLKVVRDT
jgi:hypothetical protein